MKKWLVLVVLLFTGWLCFADTITIAADEWLPFTGNEKEQNGYMIEIAKKVFEKHGHTVQFKNVPWSRAVTEAEKGTYTAIAGAYVSDAPSFIFPTEEQGLGIDAFYTLNASTWRFASYESLSSIILGVIQDYSYGDEMDAYITKNEKTGKINKISGSDNLTHRLIQMLQQKRIDVFIENRNVCNYTMKLNKITDVKEVGACKTSNKIFIAFTPKNAKTAAYAKILSDGMIELRKSGELKTILEKYGLKDWK